MLAPRAVPILGIWPVGAAGDAVARPGPERAQSPSVAHLRLKESPDEHHARGTAATADLTETQPVDETTADPDEEGDQEVEDSENDGAAWPETEAEEDEQTGDGATARGEAKTAVGDAGAARRSRIPYGRPSPA